MIQTLLESYAAYNINMLNSGLASTDDLRQVQTIKGSEQLPASETERHYRIVFVNSDQAGSAGQRRFQVRCRIDFFLKLFNKQLSNYKTAVDNYLWGLQKTFLSNEKTGGAYTSGDAENMTINNIVNIRIINGDRMTNDYFNPSIELTLDIFDGNI